MSLKTDLLPVVDAIRAEVPVEIGVRDTVVTLRRRQWSGGLSGEGFPVDSDRLITPPPHVRELTTREVSQSGGRFEIGDIRIGPITPKYAGGGYTPEELSPTVTENGTSFYYVLTGPEVTGEYAPKEVQTTKGATSFFVICGRRAQ